MKYHVILSEEKRKNNNNIVRWLQTQNSFSLSAINTFIFKCYRTFRNITFPLHGAETIQFNDEK